MTDLVNNPPHYQSDSGLEAIEVIEAFFSDNYNRGQVFKYLCRAGKKNSELEDLKKARWYIEREIGRLESENYNLLGVNVPRSGVQETIVSLP